MQNKPNQTQFIVSLSNLPVLSLSNGLNPVHSPPRKIPSVVIHERLFIITGLLMSYKVLKTGEKLWKFEI